MESMGERADHNLYTCSFKISSVVTTGKGLEQMLWERQRTSHSIRPRGAWTLNRKVRQVYNWLLKYKITMKQCTRDTKTQAPLQRYKSKAREDDFQPEEKKTS